MKSAFYYICYLFQMSLLDLLLLLCPAFFMYILWVKTQSTSEAIKGIKANYLELIYNLLFILNHNKLGSDTVDKLKPKLLFLDFLFKYTSIILFGLPYAATYTYTHKYRNSGLAHKYDNYPLNLEIILRICRIHENPFRYQQTIGKDWQTFLVQGQIVNVLGFMDHMTLAATISFCRCSKQTAIDKTLTVMCGYVPIKLYSWTLKFDLHIIVTSHEIKFFFWII